MTAGASPGSLIVEAMQSRGLTVDDLAATTRLRPGLIASMTQDDFADTGGDVYARGHLRVLAGVLGLDADGLLIAYDESVDVRRPPAP